MARLKDLGRYFTVTSYDANKDEGEVLHSKHLTPAARDEVYRVLMERKAKKPGSGVGTTGVAGLVEELKKGKKRKDDAPPAWQGGFEDKRSYDERHGIKK